MEYKVVNPNEALSTEKIRMVAGWLVELGLACGTIPNPEEKEADFIGKEKA